MKVLLGAALKYAENGWPVLPLHDIRDSACSCNSSDCTSPGKHPRTRYGVKDASDDPFVIRSWWNKWPDANIGVATGKQSGIIVLDIDPKHGGCESLEDLLQDKGSFQTLAQSTGGSGVHYIFNYPTDVSEIRNSAGQLGDGLDVRGDNGYIVAPPSNHISGGIYQWNKEGFQLSAITDTPDWLLDLFLKKQLHKDKCQSEFIYEGTRNNDLTSLAGKLRSEGMKRKAIEITLQEENILRCKPPLSSLEVAEIATNIAKYPVKPKPFIYIWRDAILSHDGPKSSTTRLVGLILSVHMNNDGKSCYPTHEQMAQETKLSKRCVGEHVQRLEKQGWIAIYTHMGVGQSNRNYGYVAILPAQLKAGYAG